jgi:hypothetical protein
MKLYHKLLMVSFLSFGTAIGASNAEPSTIALSSIPPHIVEALNKPALSAKYSISTHLNPFYVQGDFDGDGKLDCAILVKHKASGKLGIAIVHGRKGDISVLGAGKAFGNGGDDFAWMDVWYAYSKGQVSRGVGEGSQPTMKGDALMLIKTESASGLAYWTGTQYSWYQQGD